jgi:hypothetical protein
VDIPGDAVGLVAQLSGDALGGVVVLEDLGDGRLGAGVREGECRGRSRPARFSAVDDAERART